MTSLSPRILLLPRRRVRHPLALALVRHAVVIVLLIAVLYPVAWMVLASFRPDNQVLTHLSLFGGDFTLGNYAKGLNPGGQLHFSRFFLNSAVVALLSVAGNILACTLTAYAFARLEFPLKKLLFAVLMATILLPYHVTIVPQYILFDHLHWLNTYLPLVLPKFLGTDAFFIFLNVQFIRSIPRDLDESARIDGCGHMTILTRIILPLCLPAIGTTAMFTFLATWNDFLGPLLYLSKPELYTVPLGLNQFIDSTGTSTFGALFAMAVLSLAPLVGFFLCTQRLLTEGISTTGIK